MMKKILAVVLVFVFMCVYTIPAIAASVSELEDKKDELESQKQEVQDQKEAVSAEKESVMDEVIDLTAQIAEYESQISELNDKIDSLETSDDVLQFLKDTYIETYQHMINKGEIIKADPNVIASGIFVFFCSSLIYKLRREKNIEVPELYAEIEKSFIKKLKE